MPDDALKAIIDKAVAAGYDDEDIRLLAEEHKRRQPARAAQPIVPGNIDLSAQPKVKNPDGSVSTVDSIGINLDGREYLLPTVTPDGRHFVNEARTRGVPEAQIGKRVADMAVAEFRKTGRHLGAFATPDASTAYAQQLHKDYEAGKYDRPSPKQAGQAQALALVGVHPAAVGQMADPVWDAVSGFGSAVANTVMQGGDLIRRGLGMDRVIDRPAVQRAITAPPSAAGQVGRIAGDVAQYAIPVSKVSALVKGGPLVGRMAAEAATSAGVAGLQTGGDTDTMTGAAIVGGGLPVVGAVARPFVGAAQRAAYGAKEGGVGGAIAAAVRSVSPGESGALLTQALKPRSSKVNFRPAIDRALPELKAAEKAIGEPITNLETFYKATKAAKGQIQNELNVMRGQQRAIGAEVDLSSVADAMIRSIPKKVRLETPEAAEKLVQAANVYRRSFSIDDTATLLRETNAELDSFYSQFPRAQRSGVTANPATAALDAQARTLREALYRKLDAPGQGAAARELNKRYGALLELEGEALRRMNVAARQQPESLSEQIGAVRAAGEMARGTWRILHGDVAGAADIAAGVAGRSTAKAIRQSQTVDALIRRAFSGYKGQRVPVEMPRQRPVSGLLGPGARPMPPPADPSFVRGVPAMRTMSERPALPPGRRVFEAPPVPDPSGGRAVSAAPMAYAVDPYATVKAGGFRVAQFSGDPKAAKAALVNTDVQGMLTRMLDDLNTFTPQRGRLVRGEGSAFKDTYAYGGAGSPVGDDIRVISDQHVGNAEIVRAVQDLLEGKTPSTRLHTAALDAAMGYLEKRPGYRGPSVPSADVDDGWDAFSRAVDELAD